MHLDLMFMRAHARAKYVLDLFAEMQLIFDSTIFMERAQA